MIQVDVGVQGPGSNTSNIGGVDGDVYSSNTCYYSVGYLDDCAGGKRRGEERSECCTRQHNTSTPGVLVKILR